MKKSFAFGEAVGLTPYPLSAVRLPSTEVHPKDWTP